MNFTSTSEIKARVYELYLTEDQELNSNFFDFHVRNLRSTLLKTYAEIQKAINGDAVVLLKNSIETRHGSEIQVNGILSSWKEIGEIYAENRNGLYDGNYKGPLLVLSWILFGNTGSLTWRKFYGKSN